MFIALIIGTGNGRSARRGPETVQQVVLVKVQRKESTKKRKVYLVSVDDRNTQRFAGARGNRSPKRRQRTSCRRDK
jgi:hypothetical protein